MTSVQGQPLLLAGVDLKTVTDECRDLFDPLYENLYNIAHSDALKNEDAIVKELIRAVQCLVDGYGCAVESTNLLVAASTGAANAEALQKGFGALFTLATDALSSAIRAGRSLPENSMLELNQKLDIFRNMVGSLSQGLAVAAMVAAQTDPSHGDGPEQSYSVDHGEGDESAADESEDGRVERVEENSFTLGEESFGHGSPNDRTTGTGAGGHLHRENDDDGSLIPLMGDLHPAEAESAALQTSKHRSQQWTEQTEEEDHVRNTQDQSLQQREDVNGFDDFVAEEDTDGTIQGQDLVLTGRGCVGDRNTRRSALLGASPILCVNGSMDNDDTADKSGHAHHVAVVMRLKRALDQAEPEGKLHELISSALKHHVSCYSDVCDSHIRSHPNETYVSDDESDSEGREECPLYEGEEVGNAAGGNEFALGDEVSCGLGLAAAPEGFRGEGTRDGVVPSAAASTLRAVSEPKTAEGTIALTDIIIAPSHLVTVEYALESRKESVSDMLGIVKFAVTHYDSKGSDEGGMDGSTRQYEVLISSGQLNGTVFMNEAAFIKSFEPGAKIPKRGLLIPGDAEEGVAQQAWVSQQAARKVHLDENTMTKRRLPKHDAFEAKADHIEWVSADAKRGGSIKPWSRTSIIDDKKKLAGIS